MPIKCQNVRVFRLYLFVKVHEEHDLVLDGGEQVVFVDQLVNVFVPQPQVDF